MKINTLEKWEEVAQQLVDHKYHLFQMQYGVDDPHGFIARFYCAGGGSKNVELVTFDAEIRDSILIFESRYK